jgi:hypothetical protein
MERAHQRLCGFQLLPAMQIDDSGFDFPVRRREKHTGSSRDLRRAGVGRIPSLPRPKFFSALADFALGE